MTQDQFETEYADDISLDDGTGTTAVQRLVEGALVKRNGRYLWHAAWEPLSFKQEFDRNEYPFREDDFTHDNITAMYVDKSDGTLKPMGKSTVFGQVRTAFEDNVGVPLAKNEQFRPLIEGKVYLTKRIMEEWGEPDEITGRRPRTFATIPLEVIEDYEVPADRPVIRYPRGSRGANVAAPISEEVIASLKEVLNGVEPDEFVNALMDCDDARLRGDPFFTWASGDGSEMVQVCTVSYGGTMLKGRLWFPELACKE